MTAIRRGDVGRDDEGSSHLGAFEALLHSDAGKPTQFGAFVETLEPGSRSSDRHWHEEEDEFATVLSGEVTLVEDGGETALRPGDAAAWPAGVPEAHHLVNRSDAPASYLPASYLIVGTRARDDRVHYADLDKISTKRDGVVTRTRRDGTPLDPQEDIP